MKVLNEFKTEVRTELEGQGTIRLLFSFSGQCQETSWCKIVSVAQWFLVAWWSLWLGLQKLYLLNFLSLFDWLGIPHVFGIFLIPSLSPMTCQFSLLKHGFPGWTLWLLVCFLLSGRWTLLIIFSHIDTHIHISFFFQIFFLHFCVFVVGEGILAYIQFIVWYCQS